MNYEVINDDEDERRCNCCREWDCAYKVWGFDCKTIKGWFCRNCRQQKDDVEDDDDEDSMMIVVRHLKMLIEICCPNYLPEKFKFKTCMMELRGVTKRQGRFHQ